MVTPCRGGSHTLVTPCGGVSHTLVTPCGGGSHTLVTPCGGVSHTLGEHPLSSTCGHIGQLLPGVCVCVCAYTCVCVRGGVGCHTFVRCWCVCEGVGESHRYSAGVCGGGGVHVCDIAATPPPLYPVLAMRPPTPPPPTPGVSRALATIVMCPTTPLPLAGQVCLVPWLPSSCAPSPWSRHAWSTRARMR